MFERDDAKPKKPCDVCGAAVSPLWQLWQFSDVCDACQRDWDAARAQKALDGAAQYQSFTGEWAKARKARGVAP